MTNLAPDGMRTATNGTVYDRRKVYEITTSAICDVVKCEWNEVVKTGEQVTEQRVYHVIAVDEHLARALFQKNWGSEFMRHTLVSVKVLFVIDGEIETGHN